MDGRRYNYLPLCPFIFSLSHKSQYYIISHNPIKLSSKVKHTIHNSLFPLEKTIYISKTTLLHTLNTKWRGTGKVDRKKTHRTNCAYRIVCIDTSWWWWWWSSIQNEKQLCQMILIVSGYWCYLPRIFFLPCFRLKSTKVCILWSW